MRNKKMLFGTLSLLFLFVLLTGQTQALSIDKGDSSLFFGQNHSYSVFFRGNGEAIVYGRIVITNSNEQTLYDYSVEIPKVIPSELVIFQQRFQPVCVQYDYQRPLDPMTGQSPCLKYQDYNYYGSSYPSSPSDFSKVTYTKTGNLYRLSLPYPIGPNKSGVIIFSYAAFGYVSKSFGLFKFNFETPKVPFRVQEMRVALDVDADLYLRGKKAKVDYTVPADTGLLRSPLSAGGHASTLSSVSSYIGSYGTLVKNTRNLAPNESFIVKGEYSGSKLRLYLGSIIWSVLIIAAVIFGIYFLRKYLKKRSLSRKPDTDTAAKPGLNFWDAKNIIAGLASAALVILLTIALNQISRSRLFDIFPGEELFLLLFLIMIFMLYVLLIFGPAIYFGAKYGMRTGVAVIVFEILWFIILLTLWALLFSSGLDRDYGPMPFFGFL